MLIMRSLKPKMICIERKGDIRFNNNAKHPTFLYFPGYIFIKFLNRGLTLYLMSPLFLIKIIQGSGVQLAV